METWMVVLTAILVLVNGVLVVVTAWYARLTRNISASSDRAATAAERSAKHAARSAEAAELAIVADVMPLVVTEWLATSSARGVQFMVRNVGRSTALNIVLRYDDDEDKVVAIAPGGKEAAVRGMRGELTPAGKTLTGGPVDIEYDDAIGNRYRAVCQLVATSDQPMYQTFLWVGGDWKPLKAWQPEPGGTG